MFWKEEQWIKRMILNVQIAEKERVSALSSLSGLGLKLKRVSVKVKHL